MLNGIIHQKVITASEEKLKLELLEQSKNRICNTFWYLKIP